MKMYTYKYKQHVKTYIFRYIAIAIIPTAIVSQTLFNNGKLSVFAFVCVLFFFILLSFLISVNYSTNHKKSTVEIFDNEIRYTEYKKNGFRSPDSTVIETEYNIYTIKSIQQCTETRKYIEIYGDIFCENIRYDSLNKIPKIKKSCPERIKIPKIFNEQDKLNCALHFWRNKGKCTDKN